MADLGLIKQQFLEIYNQIAHVSESDLLEGLNAQVYPCFNMLDEMAALTINDREAELIRSDRELFRPSPIFPE